MITIRSDRARAVALRPIQIIRTPPPSPAGDCDDLSLAPTSPRCSDRAERQTARSTFGFAARNPGQAVVLAGKTLRQRKRLSTVTWRISRETRRGCGTTPTVAAAVLSPNVPWLAF